MEQQETKKVRTTWERIFIVFLVALIVEILLLVGWKAYTIVQQQRVDHKTHQLQERQEALASYESAVEYDRFIAIKDLEEKSITMPWFEHIPKILAMFQDLRDLWSDSSKITLSDFKVSLEEISLRWSISTLKALYYNSEAGTFKALLDRFEELDFIKDMKIKSYEKVDSNNFEFVLNANVVTNE